MNRRKIDFSAGCAIAVVVMWLLFIFLAFQMLGGIVSILSR